MDLDFSSLWSWTLPLWGLFLIVLFLGGVLTETVVLQGLPSASQKGSGRKVRFSLPADK
jgi:hypothetical protein